MGGEQERRLDRDSSRIFLRVHQHDTWGVALRLPKAEKEPVIVDELREDITFAFKRLSGYLSSFCRTTDRRADIRIEFEHSSSPK